MNNSRTPATQDDLQCYKEDESIRRFIQKSAAIAFVPPNFVRVSWDGLKDEMPDNSKVQSYSDYFDET